MQLSFGQVHVLSSIWLSQTKEFLSTMFFAKNMKLQNNPAFKRFVFMTKR